MKLTLADVARIKKPCNPAVEWVNKQPSKDLGVLWHTCRRGDWLLWLVDTSGVDVSTMSYWCAESARQMTLRMLDATGVCREEIEALRNCAPVANAEKAEAANEIMQAIALVMNSTMQTFYSEPTLALSKANVAWAKAATESAVVAVKAAQVSDSVNAVIAATWVAWAAAQWVEGSASEYLATVADYVRSQVTYDEIEAALLRVNKT